MAQVLIDFHLDEDKISENAEHEAAQKIVKEMFGDSYNKYARENAIRSYVLSIVREILEPEKDNIIAEAVKEVVANLHRTKAVKELLNDATKSS